MKIKFLDFVDKDIAPLKSEVESFLNVCQFVGIENPAIPTSKQEMKSAFVYINQKAAKKKREQQRVRCKQIAASEKEQPIFIKSIKS